MAQQDVDSLFAVDFLVAVHRDHDGGVKLRVVNFEGEIAGDLAVVADPPAVLLEARTCSASCRRCRPSGPT